MKIVCEACQAKYSIADDKVRGKVFKIRCKKCSHVIVVRGAGEAANAASGEFATSPSSAPDLTLDAGWHIVVEGEQVGPLSEADIKGRLVRGEITSETYIWKEGLPDWVKISTLPEFAHEGAGEASPFAGGEQPGGLFAAGGPTAVVQQPVDVFAGATGVPKPTPGDLFAAPAAAPMEEARTNVANGGGYSPGITGGGAQVGGLTGQRHENSVLFSLSNLEALAKPTQAPLPSARASAPSTSTTTEGSGLIDIRAMANMTLGGQAGSRPESRGGGDLPAFSAPTFSPVAPVLLAPPSSTPKWMIGALAGAVVIILIGLVVVSAKMFSTPVATVVPPPTIGAAPPPPGAAAAKAPPSAATPTAAAPPTTPPPAPAETLPPREPAKPAAAPDKAPVAHASKGPRSAGAGRPRPAGKSADEPINSRLAGFGSAPAPKAAPEPARKKDDIEALLEAAAGPRKSPAARREEEAEPARGGEKLPPLGREEIVKGMNGVLPKARDCFQQFKVPGVANAKITVDQRGRVTAVGVSGKFAGTPSGNCVEGAIKSARFAPSAGLTFDYPVPLR
jgi:predicted Zn finger-like uncharacterized protein